jgi:hypothetical protein
LGGGPVDPPPHAANTIVAPAHSMNPRPLTMDTMMALVDFLVKPPLPIE